MNNTETMVEELSEAQLNALTEIEELPYQGFNNLALTRDGAWYSPADSAPESHFALFSWTARGYRLRDVS